MESRGFSVEAVREKGTSWWFLGTVMSELSDPWNGGIAVSEAILPEGASPPLHVHDDLDDSFYVIEGRMVVRCGDDVGLATAGSWVPFPRGVPHTFRVLDGPARTLQVQPHRRFMDLVGAVGERAEGHELPDPLHAGPSVDVERLMREHGITSVGGPMEEDEAQRILRELLS